MVNDVLHYHVVVLVAITVLAVNMVRILRQLRVIACLRHLGFLKVTIFLWP